MNPQENVIYHDYLSALLKGDRAGCYALIKKMLHMDPSVIPVYEKLIKKSLYEIGELWESNHIGVATEHLSSAITQSLLNDLYRQIITGQKTGQKILAACVENEEHQIGIKIVSDLFEMNGWDSFYLGSNVPAKDLIQFAKANNPDIIALSLSIYFNLPTLEKTIESVFAALPNSMLLIGGQAFRYGAPERLLNDQIVYLPDLNAIESYIKKFSN